MVHLPPALLPWARQLQLLARPLADALAPLLQQLDRLVGPATINEATGEPDGLSGLARSGIPERLLPGEWLLAEEYPEEFERRAVMGEQLYYEQRQIARGSARAIYLLLDAGPQQIGAPRLLHLLLLLLLARRAEAVGATLHWGLLQRPEQGWQQEVNVATLTANFLRAAGLMPVTADQLGLWRAALAERQAAEECWLAASRYDAAPFREAFTPLPLHCITIDPSYDLAADRLLVAVTPPPPARSRSDEFPLPPAALVKQVLRNPFQASPKLLTHSAGPLTVDSQVMFVDHGNRVVLNLADGRLVMYSVPGSPRADTGSPIYRRASGQIVAAQGGGRRCLMTLELVRGVLRASNIPHGKYLALTTNAAHNPHFHLESRPLRPFYLSDSRGEQCILLMDDDRSLFRLRWQGGRVECERLAQGVLENAFTAKQVYAVLEPGRRICRLRQMDSSEQLEVELHDPSQAEIFFSNNGWDPRHERPGEFALHVGRGEWHIYEAGGHHSILHPPPRSQVIGTLRVPRQGQRQGQRPPEALCLAVIEEDRRTISILHRQYNYSLPRAEAPISHATVSTFGEGIAYLTAAGALTVFSLRAGQPVLRVAAP